MFVYCADDYQELSTHEEEDIEKLLGRDNAIQDATSFMENLSEELAQLDQGNIHSLMGSETQIQELMERLEQGIVEIERMEMKMNVYDELLSTVRESMHKLGGQYSRILLQNSNLKALFTEVDELVVSASWLSESLSHTHTLSICLCRASLTWIPVLRRC